MHSYIGHDVSCGKYFAVGMKRRHSIGEEQISIVDGDEKQLLLNKHVWTVFKAALEVIWLEFSLNCHIQ